MVSLYSNRRVTKTEIRTRDWNITLVGLTMLLFWSQMEDIGTLN